MRLRCFLFGLITTLCSLEMSQAAVRPLIVGYLDGPNTAEAAIAQNVRTMLLAAGQQVDFGIDATSNANASWFQHIDMLVYANGLGGHELNMGPDRRAALAAFVNNGGTAYLALDAIQDGAQIASLFGFTLANRITSTQTGTVTATSNPLAAGPFQPATSFEMSTFGRFTGAAPSGGAFIGSTSHGQAVAYKNHGLGRVWLFADEAPVVNATAQHLSMLKNVLVDWGALMPGQYGDYNFDGMVDGADYVVWQKLKGTPAANRSADGNLDGDVDADDYNRWRSRYFRVPGGGGLAGLEDVESASSDAVFQHVPEPTMISTLMLSLIPMFWVRSRVHV